MVLAPFWFSTEHCYTALMPFWFLANDMSEGSTLECCFTRLYYLSNFSKLEILVIVGQIYINAREENKMGAFFYFFYFTTLHLWNICYPLFIIHYGGFFRKADDLGRCLWNDQNAQYSQLIARRALMLLNSALLRTRRALSFLNYMYGVSTLFFHEI